MHDGVSTYWAEHAWLPTGPVASVRIVVEGDRFTSVRPHAHAQQGDVRLRGVTLPGLADTHGHAFQRALRGRTQASPHGGSRNFWSWREQMYALASRLTPDTYFALARATYAELALAGYTAVGEFHYVHHPAGGGRYDDPNAMGDAVAAAAVESGIRLTLLDTCFLAGGLTSDGHLPLEGPQGTFCDGSPTAWLERMSARRVDASSVRLGAALHSVRSVPASELSSLATDLPGGPLHVQLSAQPAEEVACRLFYGCSPTRLLADAGVLGPDTTVVHATHVDGDDVKLLGSLDVQAALCPTSERDLADGIGPARDLSDAGVSLSLGSGAYAVADPFEEVRGVEMDERLASNERGRFRAEELLRMASANGYRSLGWYGGGVLAEGALADFVVVRDDSVRTVGTRPGQILYSATAADVDTVVVGGEVVVERGEHRRLGPVAPLFRDAFDALRVEH